MSLRNALRRVKIGLQHARYGVRGADPTAYLAFGSQIARDIRVGAYSYIGRRSQICPKVRVGRYVMLASEVMVTGADHAYDRAGVPTIFAGRPPHPETVIDDDVWIASRATILAGVRIGRGAIVGAGSLVTKDVAPYAIVAGVPARVLRCRFDPAERSVHDAMLDQPAFEGRYAERLR